MQYTIFDFSGCICNPHSASREAMACMTSCACASLRQWTTRIIGIARKETLRKGIMAVELR
ncbi:hypothetical protein [Paraburkholderia sp. RL17-337-BIB-A]|uniref:hypothetical protein n=1 Tax=Paraburkholderia sp. RL17-337-BIB-A TaxID=3031636 RepID=UPI0038BBB3A7